MTGNQDLVDRWFETASVQPSPERPNLAVSTPYRVSSTTPELGGRGAETLHCRQREELWRKMIMCMHNRISIRNTWQGIHPSDVRWHLIPTCHQFLGRVRRTLCNCSAGMRNGHANARQEDPHQDFYCQECDGTADAVRAVHRRLAQQSQAPSDRIIHRLLHDSGWISKRRGADAMSATPL
nr:hypothetical protein CFP56_04392 [Quercus suber]